MTRFNKRLILKFLASGSGALLPSALWANFSAPFVTKGGVLITQLMFIAKILCAIGIVWCLIDFVISKLKDSPVNWGKLGVIGIVSVALGSFPIIRQFFGV